MTQKNMWDVHVMSMYTTIVNDPNLCPRREEEYVRCAIGVYITVVNYPNRRPRRQGKY